jgi:hypothetical protein
MSSDLGFFAITLENNTLHDSICSMVSKYIEQHRGDQIVFFNYYCEKINTYNIPILPLSYSKYYNGDIVVFDIASLLIAVNNINSKNIYFYAQNIPWQISYNNYADWERIFRNDKLKIIAANEDIHDIYSIVWNNSIGICEEISYEKFCKFI